MQYAYKRLRTLVRSDVDHASYHSSAQPSKGGQKVDVYQLISYDHTASLSEQLSAFLQLPVTICPDYRNAADLRPTAGLAGCPVYHMKPLSDQSLQ